MTTEPFNEAPALSTEKAGASLCSRCGRNPRARRNSSRCQPCLNEIAALYRERTRPRERHEQRVCAWRECNEEFTWGSTHPKQDCCSRSHYALNRYWANREYVEPPASKFVNDTKRCGRCKEYKPEAEWSPSQWGNRTGGYCRICHRTYERDWSSRNTAARSAVTRRSRSARLLRQYNAYTDDLDQILRDQGGLCRSCGESPGTASLHIDHDHLTMQFRGLLCGKCNTGLGAFKDDPERLIAAAFYLLKQRDPTITSVTLTPVRSVTP